MGRESLSVVRDELSWPAYCPSSGCGSIDCAIWSSATCMRSNSPCRLSLNSRQLSGDSWKRSQIARNELRPRSVSRNAPTLPRPRTVIGKYQRRIGASGATPTTFEAAPTSNLPPFDSSFQGLDDCKRTKVIAFLVQKDSRWSRFAFRYSPAKAPNRRPVNISAAPHR